MQNINRKYALIAGTLASVYVAAKQPDNREPNILVFVADDAGIDFGCYGNKGVATPNIDRLASGGLRFQNTFLTASQSSPSRTSLMSGMFAHTIGTEDLHSPLNDTAKIIPSYLHEAGYRTGVMMKTHWGDNGDRQFDWVDTRLDIYSETPADNRNPALERYCRFIDQNKTQPFFLWVGFIDPHRPYNNDGVKKVTDPTQVSVPPFLADDRQTRRDLADYYDEISRMDRHIGKMIEEIEKRELLENTVIIFISDNGMPFPRCKGTLYDTGIQTPLIVAWKGKIPANTLHSNGLISSIDMAPTILDLAGKQKPENMYGKSFVPILFDSSLPGREYIFAERNWHDTDDYIRCVRSSRYKLIYNAYYQLPHGVTIDLGTSPAWYSLKSLQKHNSLTSEQQKMFECPRPMVELYDLKNDPYELNNLADEIWALKISTSLKDKLLEWQKETNDHPYWKRRRPDKNDRVTGFPLFPGRMEQYDEY